jgi:hypothetical protein
MIANRCQCGENKHFDARLGSNFEVVGAILYQKYRVIEEDGRDLKPL